ncbi:pilus assembly protein PilP [Vibrio ostreicida]|nr:pilus assembly protein PilP [Vibrio ostreicida]
MSILRGRVVLGDRMIESSSKWRDPFSVPKSVPDVEMIQSQKGRVGCIKRESAPEVGELTRHHSNKMRLTGIMDIGTAKLALIELPTGYIARAEVGQAIGLRHGKITQITANEVQIIEDQENKEECSTRIEIWLSLE